MRGQQQGPHLLMSVLGAEFSIIERSGLWIELALLVGGGGGEEAGVVSRRREAKAGIRLVQEPNGVDEDRVGPVQPVDTGLHE